MDTAVPLPGPGLRGGSRASVCLRHHGPPPVLPEPALSAESAQLSEVVGIFSIATNSDILSSVFYLLFEEILWVTSYR